MNPLSLLPPETAHRLALTALGSGLYPLSRIEPTHCSNTLLGRPVQSRLGLAAGADKGAVGLRGWERMGFGFVEAGTVTRDPRAGNPRPRIWRLREQQGLVNWLGLPGQGIETFRARLARFRERKSQLLVGVSIASPEHTIEDFRTLARELGPLADYLALNASCPNVAHSGRDSGAEMSRQVRAVVAEAGGCPVLVKLGPTRDRAILELMMMEALESGASGLIATNTLPHSLRSLYHGPDFDWPRVNGRAVGGYSGPALLEISGWMIENLRAIGGPEVTLIGVGGICTGDDARLLLGAGANAVALYTALTYRGTRGIRGILRAITVDT